MNLVHRPPNQNPLVRAFVTPAILTMALLAGGCSSGSVMVAPKISPNSQRLSKVEGGAVGGLGVAGTAYYFIPVGLNSRYQRAYADALSKAPGATSLTDVTIEESWFWVALGTIRHVSVSGEAVK